MVYAFSSAPDISEGLPFLLSAAQATEEVRRQAGVEFDCTIGGIGFRIAATDSRKYQRQTARTQKDQFDTSSEAGEQTLAQFWLRSQTSWHKGAGITNYEPGSDKTTAYRYADSLGVDPWVEGDVSLLKQMTLPASQLGVARVSAGYVGNAPVVFTNENGTVYRRTATGTATAYTGITTAANRVALAGSKVLVGTGTAIASGDASGSVLANLWTGAAGTPTPYWVKSRIIAVVGASLWELPGLAGGAWPTTALYTHPDASWTWSSVAEAPDAIIAAGYSNGVSAIYRFALQDAGSGQTPKLSQAYQVAEFPPGEQVYALHVYLGKYVGIGTSRGLRVGILGNQGAIQYGPLIIQTTEPVRCVTAADRFLYAGVTMAQPDGKSGAVRVDLSVEVEDGSLRFPYAWDARTNTTGQVDSIALLGNTGRVCLGVLNEGVYIQSATALEPSGWIKSGRIRFSTVEKKAFRTLDIETTMPGGSIQIEAIEKDGDNFYLGTLTPQASDGQNVRISRPAGTFEFLSFKFTLTRGTPSSLGPTLESYQIKALPTPRRQRMVSVPLLCMDIEEDRRGTPYGYEGFAWTRLQALEEVEDFNAVVSFHDNTNDETFEALVEQVTFEASTPSDPSRSKQGFVELLLRKV